MQRNDVMTAQLVFSSHAVKETFGKALLCAGVIEATTFVWIVPADAKAMHHDHGHAVLTIGEFVIGDNAQFDGCQVPLSGWIECSSRSEVPVMADTPPEQI